MFESASKRSIEETNLILTYGRFPTLRFWCDKPGEELRAELTQVFNETNPLPDEDEEEEKQDEDNCHEVKDIEAGPMGNEVWPGCHTLAITT